MEQKHRGCRGLSLSGGKKTTFSTLPHREDGWRTFYAVRGWEGKREASTNLQQFPSCCKQTSYLFSNKVTYLHEMWVFVEKFLLIVHESWWNSCSQYSCRKVWKRAEMHVKRSFFCISHFYDLKIDWFIKTWITNAKCNYMMNHHHHTVKVWLMLL